MSTETPCSPKARAPSPLSEKLLAYLSGNLPGMARDLRWLVDMETPSTEPQALMSAAEEIRRWATGITGAPVEKVDDPAGAHLVLRTAPGGQSPILMLGHFDTVWPLGTIAVRPYRERDGVAWGPGVFDMKAGLVQGIWALAALRELDAAVRPLTFIMNSDEELLSPRSRPLIEAEARAASAAYVLEPSQDGAVKTSRKGAGTFRVVVRGLAAHAGIDPSRGVNAIVSLAGIVLRLAELNGLDRGTTVNVGVIRGGSRTNVVPDYAEAEFDVRVLTREAAGNVEALIRRLCSAPAVGTAEVHGSFGHPALERTEAGAQLYEVARIKAAELGFTLSEAASGGVSDGNLCAAVGLPVLDGLGAVGGGAHSESEHVVLEQMPLRAALLAAVLHDPAPRAGGAALRVPAPRRR